MSPWRRLFALARPELPWLALGAVFLLLGSGLTLLYPLWLKTLIDSTLTEQQVQAPTSMVGLLMALFAAESAAHAARYYCFTLSGERTIMRLRHQVFEHLLGLPTTFFDSTKVGELQSRLLQDTTILQQAVSINISMLLRNLASAFGGLCLLFYTSWSLTLVLLLMLPPLAGLVRFLGQRVRKLSKATQDSQAEVSTIAEEVLGGIRTVRAFANEALEIHRFAHALQQVQQLAQQRTFLIAILTGLGGFIAYSGLLMVLGVGIHLIQQHQLSVGALSAFLLYSLMVAVALATLASLWTDMMRALGASERLFTLLDEPSMIPQPQANGPTFSFKQLRCHQLTFTYPSRAEVPVLQQVSFTLRQGEQVALIGPSGSGKSTLAALLLQLYPVFPGQITFDGHIIPPHQWHSLRQAFAIVSQEPLLFAQSIAQNIAYGKPGASLQAIQQAATLANAAEFIAQLPQGYDTLVGERGVQLSGGQKQRIAIARAMLRDPVFLILDEATSALDSVNEQLVQQALERLQQQRTTLMIAHRFSTIRHAQRILIFDQGQLVGDGSHEQLLQQQHPIYQRLLASATREGTLGEGLAPHDPSGGLLSGPTPPDPKKSAMP